VREDVLVTRLRLGIACVLAGACNIVEPVPGPVDVGTFPYHPLVFELDLSILAYQLHGQSLVWPIDPYFEEHADSRGTSRDALISLVKAWTGRRGPAQVRDAAGLDAIRGPGVLVGDQSNETHDPILYNYARLHPWSSNIVNMDGRWTEYLTPEAITQRIRDVYVASRRIDTFLDPVIDVAQITPGRVDAAPGARDILCAFDGETGARTAEQLGSQSLMGFVLARDAGLAWDVHVSFRGSRSGDAFRAATDALDGLHAKGNPDWITDLGWDTVPARTLTSVGGLHRGFARSMTSILPSATACLAKIAELRGDAPSNIFVTGHSLGGGLAQHFASAMLLGTARDTLPDAVRAWPWAQLKLVSFSAPRAGDYAWAAALSGDALDSPFYDPGPLETVDADARLYLDPGIVERLHDTSRAAGFRVLISTDPITTTKFGGDGTHIGTTVYVNGDDFLDWVGVDTPDDHEPEKVRRLMLEQSDDDRTPRTAWRYVALDEYVPGYDASEKGTPAQMQKIADGLVAYYARFEQYFDADAFRRDLELLFAIERGGGD
jgi:hypothetical protein